MCKEMIREVGHALVGCLVKRQIKISGKVVEMYIIFISLYIKCMYEAFWVYMV